MKVLFSCFDFSIGVVAFAQKYNLSYIPGYNVFFDIGEIKKL